MKFSNPFDRRKNVGGVPYSVFPASKHVRSSCQIGRAVPVYTIDMVQGNHWSGKASDLFRFMSMHKPVMQDFEVTFGAFWCPYVALDEVTNSPRYARLDANAANNVARYGLHAREFFNAATPDSDRRHPFLFSFDKIADKAFSGSIYDHLGYSILAECLVDSVEKRVQIGSTSVPMGDPFEVGSISSPKGSATITNVFSSVIPVSNTRTATVTSFECAPFDVWLIVTSGLYDLAALGISDVDSFLNPASMSEGGLTSYAEWISEQSDVVKALWRKAIAQVCYTVSGLSYFDASSIWENPIGQFTPNYPTVDSAYAAYNRFLQMTLKRRVGSTFEANFVRWLVYQRIYGDYFLNDLYVEKEDYWKAICWCYMFTLSDNTLTRCFQSVKGALGSHPVTFYLDYMIKAECQPVLWQKDFLTSMQISEAHGGNMTIEDGDSIPVLFFKRMMQTFRDKIARMGNEYKPNAQATYGSEINDSTLLHSQIIGYKSFNVKIDAIAQTSSSTPSGVLGDFGGFAHQSGETDYWSWTAEESGVIMILMWIRPLGVTTTGLVDRSIIKKDYLDYLLPDFGGVGYQDVPAKLATQTFVNGNQKIGIQERYFEYMMVNNETSGAFHDVARHYLVDRPSHYGWIGLAQGQSLYPLYITEYDDINRIFVDTSSDPVLFDIYFDATVTRQLPAVMRTDF